MSKLELKNIQGDILLDGLPKRAESLFFFQIIDDRSAFTFLFIPVRTPIGRADSL